MLLSCIIVAKWIITMIEQNEIDEKLLAYLLDELDDVGREEVKAWLEESEGNKEYFREFQDVYKRQEHGTGCGSFRI